MKALVQISFALDELDDDDLAELSRTIGVAIRKAMSETLANVPAGVSVEDLDGLIDWYGVSVSLRQPLEDDALA